MLEWTGADRVHHDRHADLFREHDLAKKEAGLRVEEDPSAAEDQEIEALDLGQHLATREIAHRYHAGGGITVARVVGIARKDRELDRGGRGELGDDHLQDRLVPEIQAAIRPRYADSKHSWSPSSASGAGIQQLRKRVREG